MKCKTCGYKNKEDAKFCNQCGVKLITLEYKWMKLSRVKKISMIAIPIIIFVCAIAGGQYYKNYQYETGYKLSYEEKKNNLQLELGTKNYDKAKQLVKTYEIYNDKIDKIIEVYKNNDNVYLISEAEDVIAKEEYKNRCKIENISFTDTHNGYCIATATIKNNTQKTIKHVKIAVYFTGDDENKIIDKQFINTYDNDNQGAYIKPNAENKLGTASLKVGSTKARAEIIEWE